MLIEQIRHATIIITLREYKVVVDPMFSSKGRLPSLRGSKLLRFKRANPTVELPEDMEKRLNGVTHALITHTHFDHIDEPAIDYLKRHGIVVFCSEEDEEVLMKRGLKVIPLKNSQENFFFDGSIRPVPARHGWGWIGRAMGHGVGYFIAMPNEPTLYITGDTVLTDEVRRVITELKPEWTVVAGGKAKLAVGKPLLMSEEELLEAVELSSGRVILNHMEAMDHCLIDRKVLRELMRENKLENKAVIPNDGDVIECINEE